MNTPEYDALIERLLVDELSPEQERRLRELVSANEAIEDEVFDQMWLEPLLRDTFRADPDAFARSIERVLDERTGETNQFTEAVLDAWSDPSRHHSRSRMMRGALGLCLSLAVVVGLSFYLYTPVPVAFAAHPIRLRHATGEVTVVHSDGRSRRGVVGMSIEPGDTITLTGESSVTLGWGNASQVVLTRDATLTWPEESTNRMYLKTGLAVVTRAGCDGAATLVFATRHATIDVPDTDFLLATSNRQTDITVTRGKAHLTGHDGQSVAVSQGECVVAKSESVELRAGSATPDTWSEDFEAGLPSDWKQGQFVQTGLPKGSRGAVRSVLSRNEHEDPCYQIWTYTNWEHGMAVIHDDTCLNFVYRFKKSDTVQLLTLLRSPMPDSPVHEVQLLQPCDVPDDKQWWRIPSGEWYTVSIPLHRLRNPVNRAQPTALHVATAFNFRPLDHACGLEIDRMWLARGTSKKIEFKRLGE